MFKKIISLMLLVTLLTPTITFTAPKGAADGTIKKVAYLTFDDGPSKNTAQILKILEDHDVKATFFVVGPIVEEDVVFLKDIVDKGHSIGNHTYDHDYEDIYISEKAFWNNYNKCQEYIKSNTGVDCKIFRFPGGSFNHDVQRRNGANFNKKLANTLNDMGIKYFDWDVDSGDGMSDTLSANTILNNIIKESKDKNSVIILMHDSIKKKSTIQALPSIIKFLKDQGYSFDTLNNYIY